jgi:hypothetical protein
VGHVGVDLRKIWSWPGIKKDCVFMVLSLWTSTNEEFIEKTLISNQKETRGSTWAVTKTAIDWCLMVLFTVWDFNHSKYRFIGDCGLTHDLGTPLLNQSKAMAGVVGRCSHGWTENAPFWCKQSM